ncbi:hypothetical protein K3553_18460 (plasmid) [Leisingera aquaemixtae]|uniref:hypothetical protein n=1 Tax=Leisingera aquaemixtae TaxID=1396826 RepID=UPI0021A2B4E0|nr:hypothetical protein [Leisingera aquaemixtae]UWQ26855.1 hypothetical protein K3553_18460 [Leisingera aquaemixtae]
MFSAIFHPFFVDKTPAFYLHVVIKRQSIKEIKQAVVPVAAAGQVRGGGRTLAKR